MIRSSRLSLALLLLTGAAGCGSAPEPVGSLAVTPADLDLPHAGWQRIELAWEMTAPLAGLVGEPRVSLHLMDGSGELQRTFDHPFPGDWTPGESRVYEVPVFQSALAPPLDPGVYELRAGLYDSAGNRWALSEPGVAAVRAGEPEDGFPEFSFSAAWLPTEEGADRQILARRWLVGDGAMRARGIRSAGALWLRVGIPRAGDRQEMVLDEGASQPAVEVRADCSGFAVELAGSGSHTLEIPLAPVGGEPAECRVELAANFELVSTENREKRTVVLENVAWSGSG